MGFMTARDRIAILVIMVLIIAGWGVRCVMRSGQSDPFTIYHNAVPVPEEIAGQPVDTPDTSVDTDLFAPIDINTATAEELTVLPMIGPARAEAIVAYRDRHGPFSTPEQLTEVSGIGPGILARIRPDIAASPVTMAQTASDSTGFVEK